MQAQFHPSIRRLGLQSWSEMAGTDHPFSHFEYLAGLESTGVVGPLTAWQPHHLALKDQNENLLGVAPLYIKHDSWGEFIFDFAWAEAYHRYGYEYYPKLVCAIPYTPVPHRRLFTRDSTSLEPMLAALETETESRDFSSAHLLFCHQEEAMAAEKRGWLIRHGYQYHWFNRGYADFEDVLKDYRSKPRKNTRRERRSLDEQGLTCRVFEGSDISESVLDHFYRFYQKTFLQKSGFVPFTRDLFGLWREHLGEKLVFIGAFQGEQWVAGSIFFKSQDALFGRYWGTTQEYNHLHFELCYYQAIDYAIRKGLSRVEPGAQGEFKIKRGFEPIPIYSAHWIRHPQFRLAIANFCKEEAAHMQQVLPLLQRELPFSIPHPRQTITVADEGQTE